MLGPGTGLGAPAWRFRRKVGLSGPGEGGHGIGPRTRATTRYSRDIEPIEGRISGEQILCGRGLVSTYRAVAKADRKTPRFTTPAEVTRGSA